MKRSGIKRGKPPRRKAAPSTKRAKPLPARRRRTAAELEEQRRKIWGGPSGDHDDHVRANPCTVGLPECSGPIAAHHTIKISQGGIWSDLAPLCQGHHTGGIGDEGHGLAFPLHQGEKTFARRYGVDLEAAAARMVRTHYPEGVPSDG